MRIGPDGRLHLTYCTNIHPGEDWPTVRANLARHAVPLKARLSPDRPTGIGLRLGDAGARQLLAGDELPRFKDWLDEQGLYVAVINGFPYGPFHGDPVKDRVYSPDWRDPERLGYTRRLARILSALVPPGIDGGISTVPLTYKGWLQTPTERQAARQAAAGRLVELAADLARLRDERGTFLHIDIEPEPDCLLEDTEDVLAFFRDDLLATGAPRLAAALGLSRDAAEEVLLDHLRLCYDACHFAVAYESPGMVLPRLQAAGIRLGRLQVSAALHADLPSDPDERAAVAERLRPFAESTYLHQTVERRPDGSLRRYPDLPEALARIHEPGARSWRIHFHVPVFLDDFCGLRSTQADLAEAVAAVARNGDCRHLEIETYTFDVLPAELRTDLLGSIEREYRWVLERIEETQTEAAL